MTTHSIDFRVYYEDTDAGGVVYHARYLAFGERARTEAIRSLGMAASDLNREYGLAFVVRNATLDFRAPFRLDDVLTVKTRLMEQGAASCRLDQGMYHRDELFVHLDVRLACIRIADGRAARFPPPWRALLARLADETPGAR
ncbi:tol-pal system-associated acyl-CoA thioesterase [Acetobacter oeni]|uniref:Thioesterase n=1 Tax=Acetobacter oeni TaxID=304077 RepID=A0A511XL89_9PROT|nr:tol-pal system-associated acyl-CoA thioesterase [Acetobacter oeni]MBB3883919.1 acyl-CoA thioester hydrolase [Acetobacter oeni]NHO19926.1 tol-pal system-associated acyl-CoA thioesterase [Acetobacter oeni]GEN63698.1 thioesterase [Acetobacter oeni]